MTPSLAYAKKIPNLAPYWSFIFLLKCQNLALALQMVVPLELLETFILVVAET